MLLLQDLHILDHSSQHTTMVPQRWTEQKVIPWYKNWVSSSARGKYHWRDAATPRQLGKHPLLLTRGHTSTYHRASFVIFSPAFFAGAHTTKKPASHQHHNKSHGALWLNLFNLIHLYLLQIAPSVGIVFKYRSAGATSKIFAWTENIKKAFICFCSERKACKSHTALKAF